MEEINIDLSWLDETNKLVNITNIEKKEMQNKIKIHFVYVDENSEIEHITSEIVELIHSTSNEKETCILSRNYLLKLIQTKKNQGEKKYRLFEILKYNVDLESENIQQFLTTENKFLKKVNYMEDIVIEPSVFIFHKLNSLYFIYKETDRPQNNNMKPILKITTQESKNKIHKKTKKVNWNIHH